MASLIKPVSSIAADVKRVLRTFCSDENFIKMDDCVTFETDIGMKCSKLRTERRIKEIKQILSDNIKILPVCINGPIAEYAVGHVFDCGVPKCKEEVYVTEYEYESIVHNEKDCRSYRQLRRLVALYSSYDKVLNKWYCDSCRKDTRNLCQCVCFRYHPSNKDSLVSELIKNKEAKSCVNYLECGEMICQKCCKRIDAHLCESCSNKRYYGISENKWPIGLLTVD